MWLGELVVLQVQLGELVVLQVQLEEQPALWFERVVACEFWLAAVQFPIFCFWDSACGEEVGALSAPVWAVLPPAEAFWWWPDLVCFLGVGLAALWLLVEVEVG